MPSRREFLHQATATALCLTAATEAGCAVSDASPARKNLVRGSVEALSRRDETILRLGGLGDGYKMTWGADDRQFLAVNDGAGWAESPQAFYNSRLWAATGGPHDVSFHDLVNYPDRNNMTRPDDAPSYYGHGILAVRGRIYQFLSTLNQTVDKPRHWTGAKLICSADNGLSWSNADGSSPVVWEDWPQQSRERLNFFQEPQGAFSLLSILQMGRDYSANRDGYIYAYAPNGNVDSQMNELVMFRVPISRITDRRAYEYFAGPRERGSAHWVKDIEARAVVHTFPRGWVNYTNLFPGDLVVESWSPSVVHIEALNVYLMASSGIGCAADGTMFGKPSYLGIWVSATPWGPWTQIHEDTAWTPAKDSAARAYAPQIAPKWIAPDGKSLWLVWADLQGIQSFARDRPVLAAALERAGTAEARAAVICEFHRRKLPYYAFNAQRVDLNAAELRKAIT